MRVLVIEDDEELAETVAAGLRHERMAVDVALDGEAGLARALVNDYDVIVLDRDLPGLHGDQVCARLVDGGGRSRLLMLTAAATNDDLIDGLGLGRRRLPAQAVRLPGPGRADRRARAACAAEHPAGAGARRRRARHGQALGPRRPTADAGPKEFGVLELLLAPKGRVVSAEELLARVWDEDADPFTAAVKITISRLRAKLGDPPVIETVAKAGYRI